MFRLTNLSLLSALLLAMMFTVTSCDEDQILENTTPALPQARAMMSPVLSKSLPEDAEASDTLECFTFNYPIEVILEDGFTASAANDDAFIELLNGGAVIIDFVYPYSVTLSDESEVTINGFEDLLNVLTTCFGDFDDWDDDWDDNNHGDCPDDFDFEAECFTIAFPLTVAVNGENITVDSEDAFNELLSSFEGDTISEFDFVFPFNVFVFADSSTVEITSEEDLAAVLETCDFGEWDDWGDDFDFGPWAGAACFEINYPLSLTVNDQTVTINSEEDLIEVLGNLGDVEDLNIELEYPISITLYSDSSTVTVNSEEEWEAILEDVCDFDDGGWDDDDDGDGWDPNEGYGCFEVNFPLNLSINGEVVTLNSEDDFVTIFADLGDVGELEIELVYPITVTIFSDSSTVVINSEEEWEALCDACHFDGGDGDFDDECFTINYPLGILVAGETVTVESEEALGALFVEINPEDFGGFVFPLSVTIEDTGEVVTVNNEEEFAGLVAYCE